MKTRAVAAIAAVLLEAAAVGVIGTVLAGSPGEPASANLPAVGRTPLPAATPYQICGPASAEPWPC
jgi:H+/gluconate symporter-like permease